MSAPILSRRHLLQTAACGFGSLAFSGLASADSNLATRKPHRAARAKRVIFIFMQGGPSHVDTFDYKPALVRDADKKVEFHVARTRKVTAERVMAPLWDFGRHGESGQHVSSLFPNIAKHVDDLCFIKSMHTEGVAHGPATLFLHTGATSLIRPAVGAWVTYGLGTENSNLPGFVTINPPPTKGGPRNYSNAFLPAAYQGTALGRAGVPAREARFKHLAPAGDTSPEAARRRFELLQAINGQQLAAKPGAAELEATLKSYELAFRMQNHAPEATDLSKESQTTQAMYGIGEKHTDEFGRQCLTARRLAERGVRYIQVNYADTGNNPRWDQHSGMPKHAEHAAATDKPVAGLLADLKSRGLLEDTLVWWGGEFGRTPYSQGKDGRDHNPNGFTCFLAGGGVKPGFSYGATDDYGYRAVEDRVHMHDLHATVLHLLGLDHEQLTYRHAGRDFRLTDVHGHVVKGILA